MDAGIQATKAQRRAELLAARRALTPAAHAREAQLLCDHLPAVVGTATVVCAYLPVGAEPGSSDMLDRLVHLGTTVLLPITRIDTAGEHLPLRWGRYVPGTLVSSRFGLQEPPAPGLAPQAIAEAEVVLVPALAVDRAGVRLGRGGGFYDRSLRLCRPGTRLVAVVRDSEVVDELPAERHDVPMTHALTPESGLITLGGGRGRGGTVST